MEITEKPYSPKDIALALDIGDSTLRKWCIALEEEEYFLSRTENNRRVFFEHDLIVLRHFQKLVQVQYLSMQNAAKIVVSKFGERTFEQGNDKNSVPSMRYDNATTEKILNELEQLRDMNKQLIDRLDEQQTYIEERLSRRDAVLMESLREVQETKKLMIEQKVAEEEKEQKKGLFSWFKR
ncbi:DUF3967 domain-containing protein [Pseudogracilibacillus auburnensis]|uniref:DUF3967 domain-containing protein n=1 Tax=Pseudogracilibacillus auburnensis TaxID=1494959 RepID=UPI001A95D51C|nr:DUF3967 domain-containing protein [Pseudogracilibacillus auburnensis]MBO1005770.1 DUF3967 domain-containing protein [Pseudogracilibacillus auburnensis]